MHSDDAPAIRPIVVEPGDIFVYPPEYIEHEGASPPLER